MTRKRVFRMVIFLLVWFGAVGCENDKEEYDKEPEWLKGNAYELLSSKENYSLFLKAAEMTGYWDVLSGKGLCTVFAPDDDAMTTWLSKQGLTSLSEIDTVQLKLLVGYHIIEQSYTKEMLLRFSMNITSVGNGEAYKFKTFTKEDPTDMFDEVSQQTVKIFHREKYLPVFSSVLYNTRECVNPEEVHKYLFPDVNWKGMDDHLYVGNASVKEYEMPTDNGYVYTIDKVVDLVPTLYDALGKDNGGSYTTFRELFDCFKFVRYDQALTEKYAGSGDKLHLFYHNMMPQEVVDLPELASEWAYHGEQDKSRPSYDKYMSNTYNCFAFTNNVFDLFFKDYFSEYSHFSDLPQMPLFYLLKSHADDHKNIKLIDDILENGVKGEMGEEWILESDNILSRRYCANGVLYGVDQIFRPLVFDIITRPLFQKPYFSVMANMFQNAKEYVSLVSQEEDSYTLFVVNDALFETKDIRVNYKTSSFGDEVIEKRNSNDVFESFKELIPFIHSHIIYGAIRDFGTPKYYASKRAFNYVFVKDNKIYTETNELEIVNEPEETINGVTYEINDMIEVETRSLVDIISNDVIYTDFFTKLHEAKLFNRKNDKWEADFLAGDRYMVFVPTKSDLEKITETGDDLANYLKYFFVPTSVNLLADYILPNFGNERQELLETLMIDTDESTPNHRVYEEIYVKFNDNESLRLENKSETLDVVTNGTRADFAKDGVLFQLNGAFSPTN